MAFEQQVTRVDGFRLFDDDDIIDRRVIEQRRLDARAKARNAPLLRRLAEDHRAFGVHRDDAYRGIVFLEAPRHAGHRPRGADANEDVVHVRQSPADLAGGEHVVSLHRIGICVLVCPIGGTDALRQQAADHLESDLQVTARVVSLLRHLDDRLAVSSQERFIEWRHKRVNDWNEG